MPTLSPTPRAAPSSARLPTVGEKFDKYTLLAKLATGGMAELFVARLSGVEGFRKTFVIKRILPHVAHDEQFLQMFHDEARTSAQITHPNVCQVFELCEADGSPFLVLEHLEGATVGSMIRRSIAAEQSINLSLATGILLQACDGLHAAHEQMNERGEYIGLVHRDVSPGNIFVTVDGLVKILDFGIAKATWMSRKTRTGTLLGKCEYMSPEQARGGVTLDRRSDIFSLGVTAWEMLCGQRLFRRESDYESLKAVTRTPVPSMRSIRPNVPLALEAAIMRALERDRDDRYDSAFDFRSAIAAAMHGSVAPKSMFQIAPIIRKSFSEDLLMQRNILKRAAQTANALEAPAMEAALPRAQAQLQSIPPMPVEQEPCTRASTDMALASLDSGEESVELTFRTQRMDSVDFPMAAAQTRPTQRPEFEPGLESSTLREAPAQREDTPDLRGDKRHRASLLCDAETEDSPIAETFGAPAVDAESTRDRFAWTDNAASVPPPVRASAAQITALPAQAPVAHTLPPMESPQPKKLQRNTWLLIAAVALSLALVASTFVLLEDTSSPADRRKNEISERQLSPARAPAAATQVPAPQRAESAQRTPKPAAPVQIVESPPTTPGARVDKPAPSTEPSAQEAVVTSLQPSHGKLEIRSSKVAQVFLYPEKNLVGLTPLTGLALPAGNHKLKLVELESGQKKYLQVRVKAGETTVREYNLWR